MGIPLVAGRDFAERDTNRSTLVAILSEAEARRLFGKAQKAVGKRIQSEEDGAKALRLDVVGVVNDRSRSGLDHARMLYVPSTQRAAAGAMTLVVRASSPADLVSLKDAVRRVVQQVDPVLPVSELRTGEDHADRQLGAVRLTAEVSMILGLLALLLAGLGLYGVVSYAVSARTREIGIRVALGAHSTNVRALIMRQGMLLTTLGLAVGLIVSLIATPVLQSMLSNLPATDLVTFVGVSAVLMRSRSWAAMCPRGARRESTPLPPFAPSRSVSRAAAAIAAPVRPPRRRFVSATARREASA
jgi:predicted lysophospholipase L1 biosynthesis ABC-type transport system permease subunit